MLSNNKSTTNNANVITKADLKKAVKTAPNVVHGDRLSMYTYMQQKDLKESAVVLLVSSHGMPEQFTIHRPIGITDCNNEKDWVITRTQDVPSLLARDRDPNQAELDTLRARNRNTYLVDKGLLKFGEGGKVYYQDDDQRPRSAILEEASKKAKAAEAGAKARVHVDKATFLTPVQVKVEQEINKLAKTIEFQDAVMKGATQTYRTMGGVLENQPQVPIAALKGKDPKEVQLTLAKYIYKVIGLGEGIQVVVHEPPPALLAPGQSWADEEDRLEKNDPKYDEDELVFELLDLNAFLVTTIEAVNTLVDVQGMPKAAKEGLNKIKNACQTRMDAINKIVNTDPPSGV